MSGFVTVARLSDVPENSLLPVEANGVKLVLAHAGGRVHALHDECSHEEFPLSDGELDGGQVTCLLHGARFDLEHIERRRFHDFDARSVIEFEKTGLEPFFCIDICAPRSGTKIGGIERFATVDVIGPEGDVVDTHY